MPRVAAGNTMLHVSKRPEVGNQPSCTPNSRMSSSPSQKFGTDSAVTDNRLEALSNGLRARAPATTPGITPSTAAAASPTTVSRMVDGSASTTASMAGRCCHVDSPKSPRTRPTRYSP